MSDDESPRCVFCPALLCETPGKHDPMCPIKLRTLAQASQSLFEAVRTFTDAGYTKGNIVLYVDNYYDKVKGQ